MGSDREMVVSERGSIISIGNDRKNQEGSPSASPKIRTRHLGVSEFERDEAQAKSALYKSHKPKLSPRKLRASPSGL